MTTTGEASQSVRDRLRVSDRTLALLFVAPASLLLLFFAVYPFAAALYDSFFDINILTRAREFIGVDNYVEVLTAPEVHGALLRSMIWTVGNLVIQVTLGVIIALLLNAGLRGQTVLRGLVLFPFMVPAIVVALTFRFMFNDVTGLVNYLALRAGVISEPVAFLADPNTVLATLIVVNSWKYTPFIVIVVLARLQSVPGDLYEAAALDGANRWRTFFHVTLPWITPVLIVAALLRTIWTIYDFDIPYLLAFGGPLDASTTLPIEIRNLAFGQREIGAASALAVCVSILLVVGITIYLKAYRRAEARTS